MMRKPKNYLRRQVIAGFLLLILLFCAGAFFIGLGTIRTYVMRTAYDRAGRIMDTAEYMYDINVRDLGELISNISTLERTEELAASGNYSALNGSLRNIRDEFKLDLLNIADNSGRIVAGSVQNLPGTYSAASLQCVQTAAETGKDCCGTEIISADILRAEGLAEKARVLIVDTPRQRGTSKKSEERALAQTAACPLVFRGKQIGVVFGARILNNSTDTVDRIHSMVFGSEKIDSYSSGSATIFLGDVRISTNVEDETGRRLTGTRLSGEVYDKVLVKGENWLDRAFVVDRWYIAAYRPVRDISGENIIGVLYTGSLEKQFTRLKWNTFINFAGFMIIIGTAAVLFALLLLKKLMSPIRELVQAAGSVASGDFSARITTDYPGEIGDLCTTFNSMADSLGRRDKQLRDDAEKQILQAEKMASVGRLASGIAHELNNPLTGVLTFGNLLLDELKGSPYEEDLKTMMEETVRCRDIVRDFLAYSRDGKLQLNPCSISRLADDTLAVFEKTSDFRNIKLEKDLDYSIPEIMVDINQIKSVINNLVANAVHAVGGKGTISIRTCYNDERKKVYLVLTDDGYGIKQENIGRIFDPFFTTKEVGEGTGLGLFVTYSVVERHGGVIKVSSREGEGTSFTVELPVR